MVPGSASEPSAASGATQHIEEIMVSSSDEDAARAPEVSGQAALGGYSQPTDRGDVAHEPGPVSFPPAPPSMQPTEESVAPFAGDGATRAPAMPRPIALDVHIPPADHNNAADRSSAAGSQLGTAGDGSGFVAADVAAGDLLAASPLADYGDAPDEALAPGSASAVQVSDPAQVPLEQFENTAALNESLEQAMDDTTAAAVEEAADLAHARRDILPDFLRTVKEDPTHENKTFKKMREMKEREVEHVRYRSSRDHVADASIQAAAQSMRMEARHALKPTQNELRSLCDESGSNNVTPTDFVDQAHKRALQVTILKQADQKAIRVEYFCSRGAAARQAVQAGQAAAHDSSWCAKLC